MKNKLRLISVVLVLSMIFPALSGIIQPVFAADNPLNVYIDGNGYDSAAGTVKIRWDAVPGATNCTIVYHVPTSTGYSTVQINSSDTGSKIDLANNTATITNIKNDIIYDFDVTLTDSNGLTYEGKRYFLARISVYAEQVDQQSVPVSGGGVESGVYPAIKLTWNMPRVYVYNSILASGSMKYANESDALAQLDESISKMNFTFNLEGGNTGSASGQGTVESIADVKVDWESGGYKATVSKDADTTRFSDVKWDSNTGKLSFYLFGVKDKKTIIPTKAEMDSCTLPKGIPESDRNFVLPHQEILPGTIYKVTMSSTYYNGSGDYVFPNTITAPLTKNPLMGTLDYTYTPVRFQLTKDSYNRIYVGIHRVNSGSVNMPELYYDVQTNTVPSNQDSSWTSRATIVDRSFGDQEYAITGFSGINPKNTVYYRIVVKSDSAADRIESLKLPYTMQEDTSRPPVPNNVSISNVDLVLPGTSSGITDTSSDITIIWDKPSNWDQIRGHLENDIYFHFAINVNDTDMDPNHTVTPDPMLEANGKTYGQFEANYRLVKYVSANSRNEDNTYKIRESTDGLKLIYTLKGYELFKGEGIDSTTVYDIPNKDNYPTYLLPNKTYYLQMYTTLAADRGTFTDSSKMSEKSLATSFTTLSPNGRDVPAPKSLEWVKTTINPATPPAKTSLDATVQIRFDALNVDWSKYTSNKVVSNNEVIYDLYMSTSTEPNSFQKIGTTDSSFPKGDVEFSAQTLSNATWFYATINKFTDTAQFENRKLFGNALSPNTTYYFMVKVRLRIVDSLTNVTEKSSIGTKLLSVTTPRGEATIPDETGKRPVAPTDFAIATDSNGNPLVTGQSVTFEWTVKENAAAYNLIATTNKVASDTLATDNSILLDNTYKSFISTFGNRDYDGDASKLSLDPKNNPLPANFVYDSTTKKCRYTINTWLYPNKIYYFTLRAEVGNKSSLWVSIPVTTSLIESPTKLQVVNDCELAFNWIDSMAGMTPENYSIYLKTSADKDYTQLTKAQFTIVKDDSVCYGRTTSAAKLKANTQYSIKIVRTTDNAVLSTITKFTRDDYHQIDVKWQGYRIDAYSGFEIAIKTEDDTDYTTLTNSEDLEYYADISTHNYPYYIEKDSSNLGTNYYIFNAKIKQAPKKLADGTIQHRPLSPNTKYYIKVRAVKTDSTNSVAVTPSKYVGPVDTRTEFSQGDYDNTDINTNITAKFLDMLDKLEQDVYWEVSKKNGITEKILVRDDKLNNILESLGNFSYTIDISQNPDYINNDEIYFAKNILDSLKSTGRSVIIKTRNTEYTIRPDTFNADEMDEFKNAKAATVWKDTYLKVNTIESKSIEPGTPANATAASTMSVLSVQAVVSRQTAADLNAQIKDKLYNDKTGIIQRKVAIIKSSGDALNKKTPEEINTYLNQLYDDLVSELSYYLEDTLNGTGYTSGILADKYNISQFSSPLGVRMLNTAKSISNPYIIYGNGTNWQKLTKNLKYEKGYLSFYVSAPGKYAIFSAKDVTSTVSDKDSAKPYIAKLAANYDLTTVFPGADTSFNSDLNVTVKEGILLYELIIESQNDSRTDAKIKAQNYGISKIINTANMYRNLTRQETAALVMKLYCQRTGADYDRLKTSYGRTIKDDNKINSKYAAAVYGCLQMNLMTLDSSSYFNPNAFVNRAEIVTVLEKMLEA
jgi:hypothetical protein